MSARLALLQNKLVYPGEELATIEEFIPGDGCYVHDSKIYSAIIGRVQLNMSTRRISVHPLSGKPHIPRKNMQVYGYVASIIRDDLALIKIIFDERGQMFSGEFTGILHISQATPQKVNNMYEVLRVGDVVKVTILNSTSPYIVSTKHATNGVVLAFCSKCGAPLFKVPGEEGLVCPRCGNREKRKTAARYMLVLQEKIKSKS
ncbi:MAG: exosome complex RNA-binding protein Csl4 [Pyrodictiaceae archaeon]